MMLTMGYIIINNRRNCNLKAFLTDDPASEEKGDKLEEKLFLKLTIKAINRLLSQQFKMSTLVLEVNKLLQQL